MKILSIVGARPQFIKEAIVQKEMRKHQNIEEIVIHTGQHYDNNMSDIFFSQLGMRAPDINLNIGSGLHGAMTAKMMLELERIMIESMPDMVFLYGDTNSTLAGALVAAKLKIEIAHIEAGLRQEPKDMPEEINRVLTDHSSKYFYCPSMISVENLKNEGINKNVYFVGDVMYDLFKLLQPEFDLSITSRLGLKENNFIVTTLHRDFNVDHKEQLEPALRNLDRISKELPVVFPLHPRTKKRISEFGLEELLSNIKVIEPIGYLEMMGLITNCFSVITDSGGLQKEAYFAKKRAVILMCDSGWRELITCGWNKLSETHCIYNNVFGNDHTEYPTGIYGDGVAAQKIIQTITI